MQLKQEMSSLVSETIGNGLLCPDFIFQVTRRSVMEIHSKITVEFTWRVFRVIKESCVGAR